jgi:hypothetical protein
MKRSGVAEVVTQDTPPAQVVRIIADVASARQPR